MLLTFYMFAQKKMMENMLTVQSLLYVMNFFSLIKNVFIIKCYLSQQNVVIPITVVPDGRVSSSSYVVTSVSGYHALCTLWFMFTVDQDWSEYV